MPFTPPELGGGPGGGPHGDVATTAEHAKNTGSLWLLVVAAVLLVAVLVVWGIPTRSPPEPEDQDQDEP